MNRETEQLKAENERYKQWVNDLQSGMYVNCVYCGYRYGPEDEVPSSMADALKEHIEHCPEHPMSKLKAELEALRAVKEAAEELRDSYGKDSATKMNAWHKFVDALAAVKGAD